MTSNCIHRFWVANFNKAILLPDVSKMQEKVIVVIKCNKMSVHLKYKACLYLSYICGQNKFYFTARKHYDMQ